MQSPEEVRRYAPNECFQSVTIHTSQYSLTLKHSPILFVTTFTVRVYACGWIHRNRYYQIWGGNALKNFTTWCLRYALSIEKNDPMIRLIGFNNSRFDNFFFFLMRELVSNGLQPTFTMSDSSSILSIELGRMRIWDLIRFLPGYSLSKVCTDFHAPSEMSKSAFPHIYVHHGLG